MIAISFAQAAVYDAVVAIVGLLALEGRLALESALDLQFPENRVVEQDRVVDGGEVCDRIEIGTFRLDRNVEDEGVGARSASQLIDTDTT